MIYSDHLYSYISNPFGVHSDVLCEACCYFDIFQLVIQISTHYLFKSLTLCSVAQSCPALSNPMDSSPPGSIVHGISWARILEWVAISSSRGYSWPRDWPQVSCISCIGRWTKLIFIETRAKVYSKTMTGKLVAVVVEPLCIIRGVSAEEVE